MLTNQGFTFIETLFVLFILCILMTLTMTLHIPSKSQDNEIQEIIYFLNEAKLYAMTSKETVTVHFQHDQLTYSSNNQTKTYELLQNSYFDEYSFTFNASGHIKKAKTVYYHTSNKDYAFVYQIGSGCFYVE